MARVLIRDGLTKKAQWKYGRNGYPEINFAFRPALAERVLDYQRANKQSGKDHVRETAAFLLEHLVSWDIDSEDAPAEGVGAVARIDNKTIARLPRPIMEWLVDEVAGYCADLAERPKNSDTPSD